MVLWKQPSIEPRSNQQKDNVYRGLWPGKCSAAQTTLSPLSIEGQFTGYDVKFVYRSLPKRDKSIRLLELFHSPPAGGFIHCRIKCVNLEDRPNYKALSYTWDSPFPEGEDTSGIKDWSSPTQLIFCNAKPFRIRQNLHDALRELLRRNMTGLYWIDSICIDQTNDTERSIQVVMMGDIFACASKVVCWLGRADDHVENAAELHRRLSPFIEMYGVDKVVAEYSPADIDLMCNQQPGNSSYIPTDFRTTASLCDSCLNFWQRRWFERLWIAQEVALARSLLFLSGKYKFEWDQMVYVARHSGRAKYNSNWKSYHELWTLNKRLPGRAIHQLAQICDDQRRSVSETEFLPYATPTQSQIKHASLLDTLSGTNHLFVKEPHDIVFGILGLVSRVLPHIKLPIQVDYGVPISMLLTEVTSALIVGLPYLSVLGKGTSRPSAYGVALPSWVPDFAPGRFGRFSIADKAFRAGLTLGERSAREIRNGQLTLCGHLLGIIAIANNKFTILDHMTVLSAVSTRPTLQPSTIVSYIRTKRWENAKRSFSLSDIEDIFLHGLLLDGQREASSDPTGERSREFASVLEKLRKSGHAELPSQQDVDDFSRQPYAEEFTRSGVGLHWDLLGSLKLAITENGLLVGSKVDLREGDQVWIVRDAQSPIVLRPVPNSTAFTLVGEVYVDGVMFGEALEAEDCPEPIRVTLV